MQVVKVQTALHRPRKLLDLDYSPHVPLQLLMDVETAGRAIGLPLNQMELIGQCPETSRRFVDAARRSEEEDFFHKDVDWGRLETLRSSRVPIWN